MIEEFLADAVHVGGVIRIVDDQEFALDVLGDGIANVHFLAIGKHVGSGIGRWNANWRTGLLRVRQEGRPQANEQGGGNRNELTLQRGWVARHGRLSAET
jgi:hypothetical protein